jgi:cytochrome c biogenesis protein CcmG/thiol:disulfide interchange protein DsbE
LYLTVPRTFEEAVSNTMRGATEHSIEADQAELPSPRRRVVRASLLALLVVSLVVSMLLVAWGGKRGLKADPVGSKAPGFTLTYLENDGSLSLSSLRGHVVVLNFWASWCTECKREAPELEKAYNKWRSRGVEFIGVDFQDSRRWGRDFQKKFGLTYRSVFDGDSRIKNRYGVTGVPETFVLDAEGNITAKLIGATDVATLDNLISGALTQRRDPSS